MRICLRGRTLGEGEHWNYAARAFCLGDARRPLPLHEQLRGSGVDDAEEFLAGERERSRAVDLG